MNEVTTYLYHLNFRHMSGRVVKFRVLDIAEIDLIRGNAARVAGEDADMDKLLTVQRKMLVAAFIVGFTAPGQAPARVNKGTEEKPELVIDGGHPDVEKLKGVEWKTPDSATLESDWAKVFSTKETAALVSLYRDWHEINAAELEMILGKGIPTPTGV